MLRIIPALLTLALVMAACAAPGPAVSPAPTGPVSEAERVVQAQVDAYNRHDIDAFVATYAPDVVLYRHPDQVMMRGTDAMRTLYGQMFTNAPALNVRIANRIVQGDFVIDHEVVTGAPGAEGEMLATAVYEVKAGRIQNVWFIH
ncbi:nuclear transport factor 2 family protein [Longimicrobium terrae]|uniref:SnoaL-like domain-containing protein n=1 Tax=Longimicrobium terrae TaxID=1639882 RepID=A0A841GV92_9BACT|nr:nuclear transport factor 2 family protein [Longimicrobium terrae]MBB4634879.1 hypothetical protein [Longimicrobium terrae]MBB6069274.1 hypothetical protein [Longimicrobium terrae]NNC31917.1 SnoaL-like domain-containing protein [Longimicrobium terrae]